MARVCSSAAFDSRTTSGDALSVIEVHISNLATRDESTAPLLTPAGGAVMGLGWRCTPRPCAPGRESSVRRRPPALTADGTRLKESIMWNHARHRWLGIPAAAVISC